MPDDLRTRIAAVLFRLRGFQGWDDETDECREMWRRDADAVISELGLRREARKDWVDGPGPGGAGFYQIEVAHRYVTEWTARD